MKPIPKIIHQVHMGTGTLTEQELNWQATWKDKNPGWSYVFWDDRRIKEKLKITHPDILDNCKSYSEKSDILRFEILHQFGGVYVDTDFECLKNIDPIIKDKSITLYWQQKNMICGAFFGATRSNPQVKQLIDKLPEREKSHGNRHSDAKYGPVYITQELGPHTGIPDGSASDKKTVYPYLWNEPGREKEDFSKTHPEAYAVHHWNGSWR